MLAVIQAGGAGTRLKAITGDLPKPMVPICGKPILQWQIESLVRSGCTKAILIISKKGEAIRDYFKDGTGFGLSIEYVIEETPLGTGGALALLTDKVNEDFLLVFGDLMLDVDFARFYDFHQEKGALITTFVHPNGHPYDSDVLVEGVGGKAIRLLSKKEPRDFYYENLTNAGLYVVSKTLVDTFDPNDIIAMDFEKDLMMPSIACDAVYCYRSSEYVKDCGTPDRYESVTNDCKNGIIAARNLANAQKCIFLDRDGTINVFGDYVTSPDKLFLREDAGRAIKKINESAYLAICVTNQPVVARGETDLATLKDIHNKLEDLLGEQGAYLNDLYFCPHHPDKGFPGEVPEFKIKCNCRKPNIGMLEKAKERYHIDFSASWLIGDTCQDIQTGINAGCRTILLTCGDPDPYKKYKDAKPDFICASLEEAVDKILSLQ